MGGALSAAPDGAVLHHGRDFSCDGGGECSSVDVDVVIGQPRQLLGPGSSFRWDVAGVGSTICGHLPKFVARRVRSGLPPPPPSRVGARATGFPRGRPRVFGGFRAPVGVLVMGPG